eukprot:TRINITY_DN30401_c0_g1_i1.p1 TRINITY_DN30401_c0_g1~~TRINITY_DN30401_c0_g1_i1.p1  ORF type:complete len:759 (+),score=216.18 TRINITY_DN30401_c0_g1_i1:60-2279(+)
MPDLQLEVTWGDEAVQTAAQERLECCSCRVEELDAEADTAPHAPLAFQKPTAGGRCTARIVVPETYEVRALEIVSSARTVEAYGVDSAEEDGTYWGTTRGEAAEAAGAAKGGKLWRCVFDLTPDAQSRKPLRKAKAHVLLKFFSMTPAAMWSLMSIRLVGAPYQGPPTPPRVAMEQPALEQLMGLAVKFMGGGRGVPSVQGLLGQGGGAPPQLAALLGSAAAPAAAAPSAVPAPALGAGCPIAALAAAASDGAARPSPRLSPPRRPASPPAQPGNVSPTRRPVSPPRAMGTPSPSASPSGHLAALAAAAQKRHHDQLAMLEGRLRVVEEATLAGSPPPRSPPLGSPSSPSTSMAARLAKLEQTVTVLDGRVLGRATTAGIQDDKVALLNTRIALLEDHVRALRGSPPRGASYSPSEADVHSTMEATKNDVAVKLARMGGDFHALETRLASLEQAHAAAPPASGPSLSTVSEKLAFINTHVHDVEAELRLQDGRFEKLVFELQTRHHKSFDALERRINGIQAASGGAPAEDAELDGGGGPALSLAAFTAMEDRLASALSALEAHRGRRSANDSTEVLEQLKSDFAGKFAAIEEALQRLEATPAHKSPAGTPAASEPVTDDAGGPSTAQAVRDEFAPMFCAVHSRLDAIYARLDEMESKYDTRFARLELPGSPTGDAVRLASLEHAVDALEKRACTSSGALKAVHTQLGDRMKSLERTAEELACNVKFSMSPSPSRAGDCA